MVRSCGRMVGVVSAAVLRRFRPFSSSSPGLSEGREESVNRAILMTRWRLGLSYPMSHHD